MILTPNGEMKIIADGVQIFRFWDGRWRLTDAERKYRLWTEALGNSELAERLFVATLNLVPKNGEAGCWLSLMILEMQESWFL